jgi:sec-independent protein translocase protein TatA
MRLGIGEIGLLIVLALVLFGAKRLPEIGKAAGSAIREFKSAIYGSGLDVEKEAISETEQQCKHD